MSTKSGNINSDCIKMEGKTPVAGGGNGDTDEGTIGSPGRSVRGASCREEENEGLEVNGREAQAGVVDSRAEDDGDYGWEIEIGRGKRAKNNESKEVNESNHNVDGENAKNTFDNLKNVRVSNVRHVQCFNCQEVGHLKRNSSKPRVINCYNCGEIGHRKKDLSGSGTSEKKQL